jgi:N-acetylglutamate synthase-like GNAT family acetyltransferase
MDEVIPPEFSLRQAVAADSSAIRALIHAVRINPLDLDWRNFIVAESSAGEFIGCGQVKQHGDGSQELASIAVIAAWRGRGVARAIIEYLLNAQGGVLYLTCRSSLGAFYEQFGFRAITAADMPPYFRRIHRLAGMLTELRIHGETLLVMQRS